MIRARLGEEHGGCSASCVLGWVSVGLAVGSLILAMMGK
jgi:hypothetical protein